MIDKDIDEAIETLVRACNVERRQAVTQALRRMVNGGGELMSDDEIDLLADQHHTTFIFGKVNRLRSFARALESRVLAERKPVAWLVDPGLGSAMDKFQRTAPTEEQLRDIEDRCGSVTPLFAHPTPDDALDAARYRWLREGGKDQHDMFDSVWGDTLDAAIDRARQSGEEGKS
jgi:hypothetical protein